MINESFTCKRTLFRCSAQSRAGWLACCCSLLWGLHRMLSCFSVNPDATLRHQLQLGSVRPQTPVYRIVVPN